MRRSVGLGCTDPTDGVRVEGVRVGTVWRRERSRSSREFCESARLDEVDDCDSGGLSDPNCDRVPNVERVSGMVLLVESLPIRVAMLSELARPDDDGVLGLAGVEGREYVVGVRVTVELGVRGRVDNWGLENDGRLPTTMRLRLGLLERAGSDGLEKDRLGLGEGLRVVVRLDELRVEGIARLRLNVVDRDGIVTRGLTDRLGADRCTLGRDIDRLGVDRCTLGRDIDRLGADRCTLGRETDRLGADLCTLGRDIDRLGADRVACRIAEAARLLDARRCDDPPSAASASSRTAATTTATTALRDCTVAFTKNITNLLSPAASLSGNPGLPFSHRHR